MMLSVRRHVQLDRDALHHVHEEKLRTMASTVDAGAPQSFMTRSHNVDGKAIIAKFIRHKAVFDENLRLSKKLAVIYARDKRRQKEHWFDPELDRMRRHTQACYDHQRHKVATHVAEENALLVNRLRETPSKVGVLAYQQQYDKTLGRYSRLRTKLIKQSYPDFMAQRQRRIETLLARRDGAADQHLNYDREALMGHQRELAESLDPETQSEWIERLLTGPLHLDEERAAQRTPSRRSRSRSTDLSRSGLRPASAGGELSRGGSPVRASSAGPSRPPVAEWDSSAPEPQRPMARSASSATMNRPPSRSPNKDWQSEHYVMNAMGVHFRPKTPEALQQRRREASAQVSRAQREAKELRNPRHGAQRKRSKSRSSAQAPMYMGAEEKTMARDQLFADAAAVDRRLHKHLSRSNSQSHSTPSLGRAKSAPKISQTDPMGRPSRELRAILFAQQRADEIQQEEEDDEDEEERQLQEVTEARRRILSVALQQSHAAHVPTVSSTLEFLEDEDAEEDDDDQPRPSAWTMEASGGDQTEEEEEQEEEDPFDEEEQEVMEQEEEHLIDEDLDAPEIAPPSRPWHSPVSMPLLAMGQAKKKEAELPDDGIMPHAQEDTADGEEEKWRGKLDWEEAMAEAPTPHIIYEEKQQEPPKPPKPQKQPKEPKHQQQQQPQQQEMVTPPKPKKSRPSSSSAKKNLPRQASQAPGPSASVTRQTSDSYARVSTPDDKREVLPDTALLSTNISVHDLKLLLGVPLGREETPFASTSTTPRHHSTDSRRQSDTGILPYGRAVRSSSKIHPNSSVMFVTGSPQHHPQHASRPSSSHHDLLLDSDENDESGASSHRSSRVNAMMSPAEAQRFLQTSNSIASLSAAAGPSSQQTLQRQASRESLPQVQRDMRALQSSPSRSSLNGPPKRVLSLNKIPSLSSTKQQPVASPQSKKKTERREWQ